MRKSYKLAACLLALGLVAAACAEDEDSSSDSSAAAETTAAPTPDTGGTETTAAPTESSVDEEEINAWAIDYTGGTLGEASGDPIKIGYVNQESVFPEATVGIEAAVKYVNAELGGAGGRPLELVKCEVAVEEDGAKCGNQFLNDSSIQFVMTGTILNGNQGLYDVLNGKKPVIIGNGVTNPDFLTSAGKAFTTGSIGVIPGLAEFGVNGLGEKPASAAVVYASNPAGQAAYSALLKPVFDAYGIPVTAVEVPDPGATAADVQSAMVAAGADKADVFIPLVTVQTCIAVYDAIKQLAIDPTVVTTGLCFGTPMTDHLKELGDAPADADQAVPDGWYFGGYGYSYFLPDYESGMQTYLAKIQQYGVKPASATTLEYTGFAGPMFGNLLTATKFINEIGADNLTADTMKEKVFNFEGPQMIQAGALNPAGTTVLGIPFPAVTGQFMGIQQYKDGEWVSKADALLGNPIDVTTIGG